MVATGQQEHYEFKAGQGCIARLCLKYLDKCCSQKNEPEVAPAYVCVRRVRGRMAQRDFLLWRVMQ